MKNVVFLCIALALGVAAVQVAFSGDKTQSSSKSSLVLEKKNTVALRLPFTGASVQEVQQKLIRLSGELTKGEPIYLFLDTPGGSITAGEELISTVRGLPSEVKTITSFAASMGFITVQALGERLILPNGTLMSHRAYIGMEGQIPGEFNTRVKFIMDRVEELETAVAGRLGLNLDPYQKLVKDEYWVGGSKAVKEGAADKVTLVTCGADLRGSSTETLQTFFGPVGIVWSDCPLITTPLAIKFEETSDSSYGYAEFERFKRATYETLMNKRRFVDDSTLRETFFRYVK